ncbi:MAG: GNAT family N-acetyltransferase [Dehalococcoidales bacterium]|nr:GNAT family N-acetyltransferase [Dehalococcoidales bacterium]
MESPEDTGRWKDLYKLSFGKEFPEEIWQWKYVTNPFIKEIPPVYIAEENDRIAGALSVLYFPLVLHQDGVTTRIRSCQTGNGMVHPDFQRHGLFQSMVKHVMKKATERGFDLSYGFANDLSIGGRLKTGSLYVGRVKTYRLIIHPLNTIENYLKMKSIPDVIVKPMAVTAGIPFSRLLHPYKKNRGIVKTGLVVDFLRDIELLYSEFKLAEGTYGYRGVEFMKWRYTRPFTDYRFLGLYEGGRLTAYIVLCLYRNNQSSLVKDIYIRNNDQELAKSLLWEIYTFLLNNKINLVTFNLNNLGGLTDLLSLRNGFIKHQGSQHLHFQPLNDNVDSHYLTDGNHWHIQQVDNSPQ